MGGFLDSSTSYSALVDEIDEDIGWSNVVLLQMDTQLYKPNGTLASWRQKEYFYKNTSRSASSSFHLIVNDKGGTSQRGASTGLDTAQRVYQVHIASTGLDLTNILSWSDTQAAQVMHNMNLSHGQTNENVTGPHIAKDRTMYHVHQRALQRRRDDSQAVSSTGALHSTNRRIAENLIDHTWRALSWIQVTWNLQNFPSVSLDHIEGAWLPIILSGCLLVCLLLALCLVNCLSSDTNDPMPNNSVPLPSNIPLPRMSFNKLQYTPEAPWIAGDVNTWKYSASIPTPVALPGQLSHSNSGGLGTPPPICPYLIMPNTRACFMIDMACLSSGTPNLLDIMGSSGMKLLDGSLEVMPDGRRSLVLTPVGMQHLCACVFTPPRGSRSGMKTFTASEVYGHGGVHYGTIEPDNANGANMLKCKGRPVMVIELADPQSLHMTALTLTRNVLATAARSLTEGDGMAGHLDVWKLEVEPGVDAVLVASCMLAIILMSGERQSLPASNNRYTMRETRDSTPPLQRSITPSTFNEQ